LRAVEVLAIASPVAHEREKTGECDLGLGGAHRVASLEQRLTRFDQQLVAHPHE
jgi:hypothetical protein